jgi:vacuolar protein sorting-associated protein 13A/C
MIKDRPFRPTRTNLLEVSPNTKRRSSFSKSNRMVKDYDKLTGIASPNTVNTFKSSFNNKSNEMIKEEKWEQVNLREKAINLYIKAFEATELNIEVSFIARFRSDIKFTSDQLVRNHNFFQSLGLALSTIENAPIRIKKLELRNVFGSQSDIGYLFSDYYSSSLKKNFVTIIGSNNLLGNPVNFVRTVGNGVHDFVHEPIDGFKSGIVLGGVGILKGTGSLIKNTAEGTFGSFSKFSSSLSKGMLILTRDEEFIYQREGQLMSEKPKNIVEGVGFGVKRALKSVEGAILGVFIHPIKGARREGPKGFAKGMWTGLSGVIIKPIAGSLDFFSKSADGIKYNFKIFDEKNNDERIRWPRPFYGGDLKITTYNSIDSFVLVYLNKIYKKDMLKNPFVDSMILNEQDRRKILVFTTQHFLLIEMKKKSITWIIDKDEIDDVVKFRNGVKIKISQVIPHSRINNRINKLARRGDYDNNEDTIKTEFKIIGKCIWK